MYYFFQARVLDNRSGNVVNSSSARFYLNEINFSSILNIKELILKEFLKSCNFTCYQENYCVEIVCMFPLPDE